MSETRQDATSILWLVMERAANPAERNDVEAWMDERSETEGGFLWLVNQLQSRPSAIETVLRSVLDLSPRHRILIQKRMNRCVKAR